MASFNDEQHVRIIHDVSGNLDDVGLIWLDENLNTTHDCIETTNRLRLIANTLHTFTDTETCLKFLVSPDNFHEQFCVIVSGMLSSNLISAIVDLPQIITIAIYCYNTSKYVSELDLKIEKLLGVFDEPDHLFASVNSYVAIYRNSLTKLSTLTLNIHNHSLKNLSQENAIFVWFHLLFHALCRLPRTAEARTTMVEECKRFYTDNKAQLNQINEYAATYKPEQAVKWYTRDSFVYRVINRALRTQNIDTIFTFYPFIGDLHDQLFSLHQDFIEFGPSPLLTVYRGQHIQADELKKITDNIGGLLSMNSFFSTSFDRTVSRALAQPVSDLISILYEITIDTDVPAAPFSNVGTHSYFPGEEEILFSIDAVFRIESAHEEKDEYGLVWIVKLRLIDERAEQQLIDLLDYFKQNIDERCSLFTLASLLVEMGDYDGSEQFIKRIRASFSLDDPQLLDLLDADENKIERAVSILEQKLITYDSRKDACLPSGDVLKAEILSNAAKSQYTIGNYDQAASLFCRAIGLEGAPPLIDKKCVLANQINVGAIQYKKGNVIKALEICQKVADLFEGVQIPITHPALADIHDRMGILNERMGNVRGALAHYEKSHTIRLQCLPPGHSSLARTQYNLGRMHLANSNYSVARQHFENALSIDEKSESRTDATDLLNTLIGLANVCRRQEKYDESLQYIERAINLVPSEDHPDIIQIHQLMGTLQCDMGNFDKAQAAFRQALDTNSKSSNELELAEILVDFGRVQSRMGEFEPALESFHQAFNIREKFLPDSEASLGEVHYEIGNTYFRMNRPDQALEHLCHCLELEEKSLPENHVDLAQSNNSIAAALQSIGLYDEALIFVQKALDIALMTLDASDPLVSLYQKNLSSLKQALAQRDKS